MKKENNTLDKLIRDTKTIVDEKTDALAEADTIVKDTLASWNE